MILGAVSVLQAVFLPGYLVVRVTGVKTGSVVETAIVSFALSLLVNYLVAFVLVAFGLYNRTAVFGLIGLEVALAISLVLRARCRGGANDTRISVLIPRLKGWSSVPSSTSLALVALSLVLAARMSLRFNVISGWDALFNWNHWAYPWFTGTFPRPVHLYPQLIPANWSMMYLINGSFEAQLFPMALMPFFGIAILAMLVDLGLRRRRQEYLYAALVCSGMAWLMRSWLVETLRGYVDLPLAFMAVSALYLLELRDDRRPRCWHELALPLIIAAGATVTKSSGGYVLAVVLGLGIAGHIANRHKLTPREWLRSTLGSLVVVAAIPGTWYAMKFWDFAVGRDRSNSADLSRVMDSAAGGAGIGRRLLLAVSQVPLGWAGVALMLLAAVLTIRNRRARGVTLAVLVPYSLLWAVFLSYDIRNWLLMVPVAAYVVAMGFGGLAESVGADLGLEVRERHLHVSSRTLGVAGIAVAGCLVALSLAYPQQRVLEQEVAQERLLGDPGLNTALYSALSADASIRGNFLTDYWQLAVLPGFRGETGRSDSVPGNRFDMIDPSTFTLIDYATGARPADLSGHDFLLLSNLLPPDVEKQVQQGIREGEYSVVFEYESEPFQLYRRDVKVRLIRVNR